MFPQLKDSFAFLLPAFQPIFNFTSVSPGPTVDLGYATYEGAFDSTFNITEFLGVRYAAPPIGNLRWRPPHPPSHEDGLRQAASQPPMCPQAGFYGHAKSAPAFMRGERTVEKATLLDACPLHGICPQDMSKPSLADEDCLLLNVYTPGDLSSSSQTQPVLVWFHGGGYAGGSATGFFGDDKYDGKYPLVRARGGLVVVVVQYRLGMYGFLAGKEVRDAGAANAGLLDQQFALQWVQEHIHKFGGNPSDVTIWGVSAGAGSVYQHIVANGGNTTPPLFNTAITSSSFLPQQYDVDDDVPEAIYEEVLKQTGCSNLDCLRKIDTLKLQRLNADMGVSAFAGTYTFTPVIDGSFIREAPGLAIARGRIQGAHLLTVTNANEGFMFVDVFKPDDTLDTSFYIRNAWPRLADEEIAQAMDLYADLPPVEQASAIYADVVFVCPTYRLMRAFDEPYRAQFAVENALHGFDAPYYFPDMANLFPKLYHNADFETAFASAFTNFALYKDPNRKVAEDVTPAWAPWSDEAPFEMVYNKTEDGTPEVRMARTDGRVLERCNFWQTVALHVGQ
ncbi:alpha/beta-hydrolase [Schizophyllum commune H4-8]|uniref:alpha/beta-hydrolase n=1 Tax=Schizophyllum commune (strain H4-8 / FGSC 9210) TaxID=578458 RepID=UPI00215F2F07|nr:alpha/beta-hydrolase [Schizophyllum commune H4-8]KAI5890825.1 alpha/beta-hydrolase [Schizophyllum commune H4-8]